MPNIIMDRIKNNKFSIIAEIGVNYYDIASKFRISNIDAAKLMIKEAKKAGIHAVKFQTYKANTLAVKNSPYYWDISEESTTSQYELFKKFDSFGYDEYRTLFDYCNDLWYYELYRQLNNGSCSTKEDQYILELFMQ